MKELQIPIDQDEMITALLNRNKTQIRAPIHPQPDEDGPAYDPLKNGWYDTNGRCYECPFGTPGEISWVQETFAIYQTIDYVRKLDGRAFSEVSDGAVLYRADGYESVKDAKEHVKLMSGLGCEAVEVEDDKWKAPIHMPRWASRINLLIKDIQIERVQDISYEDCGAQGIPTEMVCVGYTGWGNQEMRKTRHFPRCWDATNEFCGYGWEANPWVWVLVFEVLK